MRTSHLLVAALCAAPALAHAQPVDTAGAAVLRVLVAGHGRSAGAALQDVERRLLSASAAATQRERPATRLGASVEGLSRTPASHGLAVSPDSDYVARATLRLRPAGDDDTAGLMAIVVAAGASAVWPERVATGSRRTR